ncbi:MAG: permease [Bacteroidetes bacterium]|nr:MAG: permease [Bacteroidota bacterium]
MKKLYKYMLRSYLGPFLFTFFIALFILLMQFLWKWIDEFVGKGLEWDVLTKLLFYASTTFVPMALPLAILLSSIMVFGNLGEYYELVAIKASGISLRTAMKPLVILSIFISISAFLFSNYVLPVTNLKFGALLYDVRQKKMTFNLSEGIFYSGLENYVIRVDKKDKDDKTIYGVMIYNHTSRLGNVEVTSAKKGIMELTPDQKKVVFTLFDGYNYKEVTNQKKYRITRPFEYVKFKKQVLVFDLSAFQLNKTNEDLFKNHYTMLNIRQLNSAIDSLSGKLTQRHKTFEESFIKKVGIAGLPKPLTKRNQPPQKQKSTDIMALFPDSVLQAGVLHKHPVLADNTLSDRTKILEYALKEARNLKESVVYYNTEKKGREQLITRHEVVWHQKFKLSIACLLFFFVGAPLGAIIRKGGLGMPVVMSVLIFVIYHVISMTAEKAVKTGEMDVVFGIWLSTAVILPLGLFLTWKATTDAPLLDIESWKQTFEKLTLSGRKKISKK